MSLYRIYIHNNQGLPQPKLMSADFMEVKGDVVKLLSNIDFEMRPMFVANLVNVSIQVVDGAKCIENSKESLK